MPLALVFAFTCVALPGNVAPAPATGTTVNVTTVPAPTGLPPESLTVACSGVAKAVLTAVLCVAPAVAATEAADPGVTVTAVLAEANPGAEALMVGDPTALPVTCGCVVGAVAPAAMNTLAVTLALVESVLLSVTVTPPVGAALGKLTFKVADWPACTVNVDGMLSVPKDTAETLVVASARFGESLA